MLLRDRMPWVPCRHNWRSAKKLASPPSQNRDTFRQ
jgi:hypothetical protein